MAPLAEKSLKIKSDSPSCSLPFSWQGKFPSQTHLTSGDPGRSDIKYVLGNRATLCVEMKTAFYLPTEFI